MEETESKKNTLIRISQFIIRKESEALAKDCQGWLVKTILFNINNTGLSIPEIIDEVDKQMGLKNFPASIIESAVKRLCDEKEEFREESGKYFLENEEYEKMKKIITERRDTLEHVESIIKAKMQSKLKTMADAKALDTALNIFYGFLVNWFNSESDFVANIFFSKKKFMAPDFPTQILNKDLKKVKDKDLKQAIQSSILEVFETPNDALVKFLYEVLQSYLHLEMLNLDPECRLLQKAAFSNKTLILDTNILMALFLKGDPKHDGTENIVSLSKDLGINIVFTKSTKQEWFQVLERANEEFQAIRSTRPALLGKLEDVFIRSYFKEKAANPSLTWQGYYLQMRQIDTLAKAKGIKYRYQKKFYLDNLRNKEFFEPLSGRVYYCAKIRRNPKSKEVSEHDAYHLLLVRNEREEHPPDMLGPSCWFLTHDTSLLCADEGLNEFVKTPFDPPSSFVADMWVTVIAPFLGPEVSELRLAEAFASLMTTHFATMPSGLNAEKILEVMGHWLPYKSLSETHIEAILSDALVVKYYEELREARIKNPRKVEELREKLREEVDKKVYGIFDERVAGAQKERDEAKELALQKERELLAERWERRLILRFCAIVGAIFAISGLVFFATGNLTIGSALTSFGIAFVVLALAFRYIKVKAGIIEIEAEQ